MEPLNYCRQIKRQILNDLALVENGLARESYPGAAEFQKFALLLVSNSQKFILPKDGLACDDRQLKALVGSERLNLPFNIVALEYQRTKETTEVPGTLNCEKSVVVCFQSDNLIAIMPIGWISGGWVPQFPAMFNRVNLDLTKGLDSKIQIFFSEEHTRRYEKIGYTSEQLQMDYGSELMAVLSFLNALACSNIEPVKGVVARPSKKHSQSSAIPFDDYWVLQIKERHATSGVDKGGTHRSPREHVRRGHVRRLQSGKAIWVNATIVSAGRGGKIEKDYALQ